MPDHSVFAQSPNVLPKTTNITQQNIHNVNTGEEQVSFCPSPADVNTQCDDNVTQLKLNFNFKMCLVGPYSLWAG